MWRQCCFPGGDAGASDEGGSDRGGAPAPQLDEPDDVHGGAVDGDGGGPRGHGHGGRRGGRCGHPDGRRVPAVARGRHPALAAPPQHPPPPHQLDLRAGEQALLGVPGHPGLHPGGLPHLHAPSPPAVLPHQVLRPEAQTKEEYHRMQMVLHRRLCTFNMVSTSTSTQKRLHSTSNTCLGCETQTGVVLIFGIFSTWTHVQPHQWKALSETFWMIWLDVGLSWKIAKIRTTPLFFKIDLCSATTI